MAGNTHIMSSYIFFLEARLDAASWHPTRDQRESLKSLSLDNFHQVWESFGLENLKLQSWKSLGLDRLRSSVLNEFQYHYLTKSINIHNRKIYQI